MEAVVAARPDHLPPARLTPLNAFPAVERRCVYESVTPIPAIFPPIANILTNVAPIFPPIVDIFDPITKSAIPSCVSNILAVIANVFAPVAPVLAPIHPIFEAIPVRSLPRRRTGRQRHSSRQAQGE